MGALSTQVVQWAGKLRGEDIEFSLNELARRHSRRRICSNIPPSHHHPSQSTTPEAGQGGTPTGAAAQATGSASVSRVYFPASQYSVYSPNQDNSLPRSENRTLTLASSVRTTLAVADVDTAAAAAAVAETMMRKEVSELRSGTGSLVGACTTCAPSHGRVH